MGRSPCCAKEGLNRGAWSSGEDKTLTDFINTHGEGRWRSLPKRAGLKRCGKSCRLRWLNYLRPDIVRGNISQDEEELIIRLHKLLGNRWSLIAGRLPGRTDNEIKNYWNTNLCKRLKNPSSTSSPSLIHKNNNINSKPKPNSPAASGGLLPPPPNAIKTKAMRFSTKLPRPTTFTNKPDTKTTDQYYINNNVNNNNTTSSSSSLIMPLPASLDFSTPDFSDLMLDMDQLADFRFSDLFANDFAAVAPDFGWLFPEMPAAPTGEDGQDGNFNPLPELNWVVDHS